MCTQNIPSTSTEASKPVDWSLSSLLKPVTDTKKREPLIPYLQQLQPLSVSLESLQFHDSVIASLSQKRLVGRTRAKFITDIAKAMHRVKNYPGKNDYDNVAKQIISKWKFLGEQVGYVSGIYCATCILNSYMSALILGIHCGSSEG